jgi:hypothetical protein
VNETFGTVVLNANDAGTSASPVTIGSYGSGRATINAGDGTASTRRTSAGSPSRT